VNGPDPRAPGARLPVPPIASTAIDVPRFGVVASSFTTQHARSPQKSGGNSRRPKRRGLTPKVMQRSAHAERPGGSHLPHLRRGQGRRVLRGLLGFREDWRHQFEPDLPVHLQVSKDGVVLHLSEHHGDACPGARVRIEVDDIDAYCAELLTKKHRYSRPGVQNTEWKTRETTIRDP
jgi:Glyoxalase superfamily protein